MLSTTNTINDIKSKLRNTYDFYGYSDDEAFSATIVEVVSETKIRLIDLIGDRRYEEIQEMDKTDLANDESCIYYAEVYLSASEFISQHEEGISQGMLKSFTIEGISVSDAGASGFSDTALSFFMKAVNFLRIANYELLSVQLI